MTKTSTCPQKSWRIEALYNSAPTESVLLELMIEVSESTNLAQVYNTKASFTTIRSLEDGKVMQI